MYGQQIACGGVVDKARVAPCLQFLVNLREVVLGGCLVSYKRLEGEIVARLRFHSTNRVVVCVHKIVFGFARARVCARARHRGVGEAGLAEAEEAVAAHMQQRWAEYGCRVIPVCSHCAVVRELRKFEAFALPNPDVEVEPYVFAVVAVDGRPEQRVLIVARIDVRAVAESCVVERVCRNAVAQRRHIELRAERLEYLFLTEFLLRIHAFDVLHVDIQFVDGLGDSRARYVVDFESVDVVQVEEYVFCLIAEVRVAPVPRLVVVVLCGVFGFGVGDVDVEAAAENAAVVKPVHHGVALFVEALRTRVFDYPVGPVLFRVARAARLGGVADVGHNFLHRENLRLPGFDTL